MDSDDERAYEPIDERADLTQDIAMEVAWNPIDSNVPLSPMLRIRASISSPFVSSLSSRIPLKGGICVPFLHRIPHFLVL